MGNIEALEKFRDAVAFRLRFANRDKNVDKYYEEAYNTLHNLVNSLPKHDFILAESLQESINENDLLQYTHIYEDNGFIIKLYIFKKEDENK